MPGRRKRKLAGRTIGCYGWGMRWFVMAMAVWMAAAGDLRAEGEPRTPGVALAETLTEITGVAISPLLGVSGVGSWTYFRSPAEARPGLPWFCQPWAWGTGFVVLALCFLKDSLGTAVPGVLKKPLDMVELFENKASAVVASVGFVPVVARELARAAGTAEAPAGAIGLGITGAIDAAWLTTPLALAWFAVVWVCSHSINVLILLSPFSWVDTLLKLARSALLWLVGLTYLISPVVAAVLCTGIALVALWLAPTATRLMIFGARFAGDVLLPWRGKRRASAERPHVFTLGGAHQLPSRTGGRLARTAAGTLEFRYRPFCLLPERAVALPATRHVLAKGLLAPAMLQGDDETKLRKTMVLLPRYRGREADVANSLGLHAVRDHALARGWTAFTNWLRELTGRRPRVA